MRATPRHVWLVILSAACLTAASCPNGCSQISKVLNPTGTSVQSVTVTPVSAQLTVGQTQQFTATVLPDGVPDKSVTWSVAPSGLATIDTKGLLTAQAAGQAVVTATTVSSPVHTAQSAANISGPAPANPYVIQATFISVLNGTNYLGDPQTVGVWRDITRTTPVADALVDVNGSRLTYDPLKLRYTGSLSLGLGASYSFKVSGGGTDYTASGTQFTTFPALQTPAAGASWSGGAANTMTWTNGAPTAGATNFLGIVNPSGQIFYPSGGKPMEVPITSTSFTIPAGWTSQPGDYYIYNGIGTPGIGNGGGVGLPIANAGAGSGLYVGGTIELRVIHVF